MNQRPKNKSESESDINNQIVHATTIYLCTGPVFRPSSSARPSPDLLLAVIVGPALGSSSRLVIIDKYERESFSGSIFAVVTGDSSKELFMHLIC